CPLEHGAPRPPSFRARGSAWFFSPAGASSVLEVDGAEGRSVTFHLQNLKGENLAWNFGGETILSIRLGESPDPSFYEDSYRSRVTFPEDGSALTISQLGKSDAGTYTAKTSSFKASFILRVYSVLQEPAVTCAVWNCSAHGCRYTLRCAVHTPGNKSFSWSLGQRLDAEGPELVVEGPPPGELDVLSYTCTVRNPVSSRNATVSPAAVCADSYSGTFTGTVTAMVSVALICLAVFLAFVIFREIKSCFSPASCCDSLWLPAHSCGSAGLVPGSPQPSARSRERAGDAAAGSGADLPLFFLLAEVAAEYVTVYAEVGIAPQDFPRAQKNDPKKTPAPGAETSKTIYSTIQAMAQVDELGGSTLGC
ncbi:LOW QUALITY PROTEIN: T-lymphocyte surface antigen Ly-9-like, partial [Oxyura jamaicensis]|uniref:LOW QUALITY PROTEIN: T-lymphocyte surface antigen Ly-9-like n=1 Tax=Oxyura jamaicensis TaxID=8884 RepID=UPI0015A54F7C